MGAACRSLHVEAAAIDLVESSCESAVHVLGDVRELVLKALALLFKALVRHARVLHRGKDKQAACTRAFDDARRPVGHLLFRRAAEHIDGAGRLIGYDLEEYFAARRDHFVVPVVVFPEALAERGRPFGQVFDVRQEREGLGL